LTREERALLAKSQQMEAGGLSPKFHFPGIAGTKSYERFLRSLILAMARWSLQ
jgi:hypothetical protein